MSHNLKNVHFEIKGPDFKKHNIFITIFHNFALQIETGWAKRVVKPILETRNVNDVPVYVWFNRFQQAVARRCSIKKVFLVI